MRYSEYRCFRTYGMSRKEIFHQWWIEWRWNPIFLFKVYEYHELRTVFTRWEILKFLVKDRNFEKTHSRGWDHFA